MNNTAAFDLIGLTQLRQDPRFAGIDGSGINVAVIDTGLDSTHSLLKDAYIAGKNIATGAAMPIDRFDHGTHVAGIIGANDPSIGVAPDVGLIGLGIFEGTHASNSVVEDALEWVLDNHKQHNIVAVNLSLGGGFFGSKAAADHSILYDDVKRLEAAGITVIGAAGNFYKNHEFPNLSEPAIFSTLAVGAVWADGSETNAVFNDGATDFTTGADRVASFSQRLNADNVVFAPGAYITSTIPGGGLAEMAGTSMATPVVTGAVALMQEAALQFGGRLLSPDEVNEIIRSTADTIFDGDDENDNVRNSNTSYKRLNVYNAVVEIERRFKPIAADPNGTLQGAVRVADISGLNPTVLTGRIGNDGTDTSIGNKDVDMFRFEMDTSGSITIQLAPNRGNRADFDSHLRLFNANGQELAYDDDTATGGYSRLSTFLTKGVYYAGVSGQGNRFYNPNQAKSGASGQTGTYSIQFNTNTADPDGLISGATALNLAKENEALLVNGYIGQDNNQIIAQADVDMYQIQATDSGTLLIDIDTLVSSGFVNSHLRVFDAQGRAIASNSSALATNERGQPVEFVPATSDRVYRDRQHTQFTGHRSDSFIRLSVNAGDKYYIGVSGASNTSYAANSLSNRATGGDQGQYQLGITFKSNDQNGSIIQAQSLPSLNLSGVAQLERIGDDSSPFTSFNIPVGARDVDMFRVNTPNRGILDLTVDSFGVLADTVDTSAYIFDSSGYLLGQSDDVDGRDPNLKMVLDANTDYYVAIAGYGNTGFDPFQPGSGSSGDQGDYQLTARLLNTTTIHQYTDNLMSSGNIRSVNIGDMIDGTIGSDRGFILGASDVDLYRFNPSTSGSVRIRTLATEAFSADTHLRLFNAQGQAINAVENGDGTVRGDDITASVTAGSTYYLGVTGAGATPPIYSPFTGNSNLTGDRATGDYTLMITAATGAGGEGITQIGTNQADTFVGTDGDDVLIGKGGSDSLTGLDGNDTLSGNGKKDRLFGNAGDDLLNGGGGRDIIHGHSGDDTLRGGGGKDFMYGGIGDDWLDGKKGRDVMTGGEGRDVFVIQSQKSRNRIKDFNLNQDRIGLLGIDSRNLSFLQKGKHTFIYTNNQEIARLDRINMDDLTNEHFTSV
ncbi:MAG: S8 family serine peptidase [Cyanobacteria bacterium P01_F01_bin.150]